MISVCFGCLGRASMESAAMPESVIPSSPRFQFSMWRLMIVVTLAAILLGLAVTIGGFFEMILVSVVWGVLPTLLVTCAIYGRRGFQAFAIGALVPWSTLMLMRIPPFSSDFAAMSWLLAMGGMCGAVAMATRRWIERNGRGA